MNILEEKFPLKRGLGGSKNNPYIEKVKNHPKILTDFEKEIYSHKWKWDSFFTTKIPPEKGARGFLRPLVLEIWTGLGNYFSKNVNENLDKNFIWMEIRYKRCFLTAEKTLWKVKNNDNSVDNTSLDKYNENFVIIKDYAEKITKILDKNEISETLVYFPDPWLKKKWLHKRLLQEEFLNNLFERTKTWWKLIFKTDHLGYFLHVLQEVEKTSWKILIKTFDYEKEGFYVWNSITEFEQVFRWLNIKICYLELIKEN